MFKQRIEDLVFINTNQNPKKVGRLILPISQQKEDYFATINTSKESSRITLSITKGTSKDLNVLKIKASSWESARSKATKEVRKKHPKFNIHVNYN
jgi:hypothetical protein